MTDEQNQQIDPANLQPGAEAYFPPGDHPLEIAARKGIGPLSTLGQSIWHGDTTPCVSCGQLVPRNAQMCDECEQDLSEQMIAKMKTHAGPWYVLEHVRQFPGVTLDRIVRQIRRGVVNATSIVRGPWTDHQWRFTVETPGLCLFFSRCWHCHADVAPTDTTCHACQVALIYEEAATPQPVETYLPAAITPISPPISNENIMALTRALASGDVATQPTAWNEPSRVGGISSAWIAGSLVVMALVVLSLIAQARSTQEAITPMPIVTPTPMLGVDGASLSQ